MQYGYARVASRHVADRERSVHGQLAALTAAGVPLERIYVDMAAGSNAARPGLDALRSLASTGDEVVVCTLDRLARRSDALTTVLDDIRQRGIKLRVLQGNHNPLTTALLADMLKCGRCGVAFAYNEHRHTYVPQCDCPHKPI